MSASSSDQVHRFIFDNNDIRGEIITLEQSYQQAIKNHPYPPAIQRLLGEFLAAATLLAGTLKFNGLLTLQARGSGALSTIMAECSHDKKLRAVATFNENTELPDIGNLKTLLQDGVLTITIDPEKGQRYQGIVPLEQVELADCIAQYFEQSEQLHTRFWINSNGQKATGLMLQALPMQLSKSQEEYQDHWETLTSLAHTITPEEQFSLNHETLLFRLFHEQETRVFEPESVTFQCTCSRERCLRALSSIDKNEVESALAEQGEIQMDCHFCLSVYRFKREDLNTILGD